MGPGAAARSGRAQRIGWKFLLRVRGQRVIEGKDRNGGTSAAALLVRRAVIPSVPLNSSPPARARDGASWCLQLPSEHPSSCFSCSAGGAAPAEGRIGPVQVGRALVSRCLRSSARLRSAGLELDGSMLFVRVRGLSRAPTPARAPGPAARCGESTHSSCSADAAPGMFPYRDGSPLDRVHMLTLEVNIFQEGILFFSASASSPSPQPKPGSVAVSREVVSG